MSFFLKFHLLFLTAWFIFHTLSGRNTSPNAYEWGFHGHMSIAKFAVFLLPQEMGTFYKQNHNYIIKHSITPDRRRYIIEDEAPRHFIDLEHFGKTYDEKKKILMLDFDSVKNIFGLDFLLKEGMLPWHLITNFYSLVYAMKKMNKKQILKMTSDLTHYISDANVPLHTTANYNGQLTNQTGIHGIWESQIVENWSEENYHHIDFSKPKLIYDIKKFFTSIILTSHSQIDTVLSCYTQTQEDFKNLPSFTYNKKGKKIIKQYNSKFLSSYEKNMKDLTLRKWKSSVEHVRNIIYTAWQYANKPNLDLAR